MYFSGWRSHGPDFPHHAWKIIEKQDIRVGTHADVDVMQGKAACTACGYIAEFSCVYGDGYFFTDPDPSHTFFA
jgi:hypothetical protein